MLLNGGMDRENVVHLHNGVLLSGKKNNGILKFAGKWMSLEETILSKVTQSQKDKHGKYSHINGFYTQSKEYQPTISTANETNNHGGP